MNSTREAFEQLAAEAESFFDEVPGLPVTRTVTPDQMQSEVERAFDLRQATPLDELMRQVSALLRNGITHVTHPRYFGLFNPSVHLASVVADAMVALYNPQVGAWAHAPAANEIERLTLRVLLEAMGLSMEGATAHFTTGGSEANQSALLVALTRAFPSYARAGLRGLDRQPTLYASREAHHSLEKFAHATGLGRDALRWVEVDAQLRLRPDALRDAVSRDRDAGFAPFLAVGTAGTTSAGVIDPLDAVASICRDEGLWFHADAAWGGAAALSPRLRPALAGASQADSLTVDAHKWLSVPNGAGIFYCRDASLLRATFGIDTSYVPAATAGRDEPYMTTLQWSRRFIGLKLFFAMAERGLDGVVADIEHQAAMGELLRVKLREAGWILLNDTPLPVVCFSHPRLDDSRLAGLARDMQSSGEAWVSTVSLDGGRMALRACITSYRTQPPDLDRLVTALGAML